MVRIFLISMAFVFSCIIGIVNMQETGKTYYVSYSGNDLNDGKSKRKPFRSVEKVNSLLLLPGDKVLFESGGVWTGATGLHPRGEGNKDNPIVLGHYGKGPKPVINVTEGHDNGLTLEGQSHWLVKGIEFRSVNHNGVAVNGAKNRKVENIRIENVSTVNCSSHLGQREFDHCGIRVGGHGKGYSLPKGSWFENIVIEDCVVDNCAVGIMIAGRGFDETKPVNLNDSVSKNCHIKNCSASNISGDGIVIFCAADVSIEQSTCFNACKYNADNKATAGIWFWNVRNGVIRYCESYGHITPGIDRNPFDTDYESFNTVIEYNYGHDCYGAAILMCAPKGTNNNTVVRYNVFENCGMDDSRESAFIKFYDCETDQNRYIYNNTFIGSPRYLITSIKEKAYCHIFNNIFYHTKGLDYTAMPILKDGDKNFYTKILMPGYHSNNLYFNISGVPDEPGCIFADPLFNSMKYQVGYKKSGLRLTKKSPCINAGRELDASVLKSIDTTIHRNRGRQVDNEGKPDIGAYEYSGKR